MIHYYLLDLHHGWEINRIVSNDIVYILLKDFCFVPFPFSIHGV